MNQPIPACQLLPLPLDQLSFQHNGQEALRWNHHPSSPRPFFYPVLGPAGDSLVRMGHPGAANHDHHQGIWFAHHDVSGVNFWADTSPAQIRQTQWLDYVDTDDEAVMAVELAWLDGHDPQPLLTHTVVACFRPADQGEYTLELQSTLMPRAEQLEFGKSNFGILSIRVAKTIAEFFGGGRLTNSLGKTGEPAIFGKPSRWMDYSGPVRDRRNGKQDTVIEGITCIDHPSNPGQPTRWHVREDGWIGPSICRESGFVARPDNPLVARYLLDIHSGPYNHDRADQMAAQFANLAPWLVRKSDAKHRQYEVSRGA
jgi:hypothetical protein